MLIRRLACLALAALLLSANFASAQTVVKPDRDRKISPQGRNEEGHFESNPILPGESTTTGLPFAGDYVPVLVNIDNVLGAWPQWGIGDADIIYEMPIHGHGLTRLVALFADQHPPEVGPVRSGRVMHAELREEWDAAWAYVGAQNADGSSVGAALRQFGAREDVKGVDLLFDGIAREHSALYKPMTTRKAPHHLSLQLQALVAQAGVYDYPQRPFLFTDELPPTGDRATQLSLRYGQNRDSYVSSSFSYDAGLNAYVRNLNGRPFVDFNDQDVALHFHNVIVQWTRLSFYDGMASRPLLVEVGEGNADIFMGGRHIAGYWVREGTTERTIFFDQDGNEIRLQRGKTWINVTSDKSTELNYR